MVSLIQPSLRVCDPDFNHISFCFDLSHKTCSINLSNSKSENPIKRMIPPDYENTCSVELLSSVRTALEERRTHVWKNGPLFIDARHYRDPFDAGR
jgi:hypothetical protein